MITILGFVVVAMVLCVFGGDDDADDVCLAFVAWFLGLGGHWCVLQCVGSTALVLLLLGVAWSFLLFYKVLLVFWFV